MKLRNKEDHFFKRGDVNITRKVGEYMLELSRNPDDIYGVSGELYITAIEACLFAAKSGKDRDTIRQAFIKDIDRLRDYVSTWEPPSVDEFHAKYPDTRRLVKERFGVSSDDLWGD